MEPVIAAYVQAAVALSVGILQAALIAFGLRTMNLANARRAVREDQRHEESMKSIRNSSEALQALISVISETTWSRREAAPL